MGAGDSTTCVRCGRFLSDPSTVLYSDAGDPMCFDCRERIDEAARDASHARQLVGAATGALAGAVIGLPTSFFFVLGAMAFSVPALTVAWRLRQSPPPQSTIDVLGMRWRYVRFACGATFVIGGIGVLLMVLNIVDVIGHNR